MNTIVFSHLCTVGIRKANTGRNKMYYMNADKDFLHPKSWDVNSRINCKTLSANPAFLYEDLIDTLKIKANNATSEICYLLKLKNVSSDYARIFNNALFYIKRGKIRCERCGGTGRLCLECIGTGFIKK